MKKAILNTYFVIMIIALFVFCSCGNNSAQEEINSEVYSLSLAEINKSKQSLYLSDLAKSVEYIPLETTPDNMIGYCKIEPAGDYLLIMEKGKPLRLYDNQGKFILNVGSIGKGPGEYPEYYSCTADPSKKRIFILNDMVGKIEVYNFEATHIETILIPANTVSLQYLGNDRFLIYAPNQLLDDQVFHQFQIINIDGEIERVIPRAKPRLSGGPVIFAPPIIQSIPDNMQIFNNIYGDTVFGINNNGDKFTFCIQDFGGKLIPEEILHDMGRYFGEKDKYISNFTAFDSKEYILFTYGYQGQSFRGVFSKSSKQGFLIDNWDPNGPGLPNDIDGGPAYFASTCIRNNVAYVVMQSSNLVLWRDEGLFDKQDLKNPSASGKLHDMAASLSENDNPVIMIINLK